MANSKEKAVAKAQESELPYVAVQSAVPAKFYGFKSKAVRVAVAPFFSSDELRAGIIFQVTGSGTNPKLGTPYLECTDPHTGEIRQLFLSYDLERKFVLPDDMNKFFAVRLVGEAETSRGASPVKKFEVQEIVPSDD